MRMMMMCSMETEQGNAKVRDGSLGPTIQAILEEQKPEVVYFTELHGKRTAVMVVNINEGSEIPRIAEPWFLAFGAHVEFHPAMTPQDLAKNAPVFEQMAKKYVKR